MKIINLLTTAIIILPTSQFTANAACTKLSNCSSIQHNVGNLDGCIGGHTNLGCYTGVYSTSSNFYSCTKCATGRTLTHVDPQGCSNLDPTECVCDNGCRDSKVSHSGYTEIKTCTYDCNTELTYQCTCAAGKYYNSTTSKCETCPSISVISGKVTSVGNTQTITTPNCGITSCYLTSGVYQDTTGTFTVLSGNCYYKE